MFYWIGVHAKTGLFRVKRNVYQRYVQIKYRLYYIYYKALLARKSKKTKYRENFNYLNCQMVNKQKLK